MQTTETKVHGLMAEFEKPEEVLHAAREIYAKGYRKMDAYSPFPIEELSEIIAHHKPTRLPRLVLAGGLTGCATGFLLQTWASVFNYPLNIGGRPLFSWVSFLPITFELTVLFAAFSAVFGMLGLNGFPSPYHPVFNVPQFERASQDRFFICIESRDALFDLAKTKQFLESFKPLSIAEVQN